MVVGGAVAILMAGLLSSYLWASASISDQLFTQMHSLVDQHNSACANSVDSSDPNCAPYSYGNVYPNSGGLPPVACTGNPACGNPPATTASFHPDGCFTTGGSPANPCWVQCPAAADGSGGGAYPTDPAYCQPASTGDQTGDNTVRCTSRAFCEKDNNGNNTGNMCSSRSCTDGTGTDQPICTHSPYCPKSAATGASITLDPTSFSFSNTLGDQPMTGPDGDGRVNNLLTISDAGTSDLNWSVQTDATWCRVNGPGSGSPAQPITGASSAGASSQLTISVYPLTMPGTYVCTVSVSDQDGMAQTQYAHVLYTVFASASGNNPGGGSGPGPSLGTNSVFLASNMTSGNNPLTGVVLTAVANSIASTPVSYTFFWDCPSYPHASHPTLAGAVAACGDPAANPSLGESHRNLSGASALSQSTGGHTYAPAGSYVPVVIMESGSAPAAESSLTITVNSPASPPPSPPPVPPASSSSNPGTPPAGPGNPGNGNPPSSTPPGNGNPGNPPGNGSSLTYNFFANPAHIIQGGSSMLGWSCVSGCGTSCTISGLGSVNANGGFVSVKPSNTTSYVLTCSNSSTSTQALATVSVSSNPGLREVTP